ncbi:hypothetical protein EMIT0347P_100010 [Pseudomonas sp. IT-347P]
MLRDLETSRDLAMALDQLSGMDVWLAEKALDNEEGIAVT